MKSALKILLCMVLVLATVLTFIGCDSSNNSNNDNPPPEEPGPAPTGTLSYKLNEDEKSYTVSGIGTYEGNRLIIPETYEGLPVTVIGKNAFQGCKNFVSVTIPNSVRRIEYRAFYECTGLKNLTIPDGVTSIKVEAFSKCTSLVSVTIGKNVTEIKDAAFRYCYRLIEVYNLSSLDLLSVESCGIGYIAYYTLDIYNTADAPSKIVTDENGFRFYADDTRCYLVGYMGSATDLTLPATYNGREYGIYKYAFYDCSISSVVIPDTVKILDDYAFESCDNLKSVTIGNGIETIGNYAFSDCVALTDIKFGSNVKVFGSYAFEGCIELGGDSKGEFVIPNTVTTIGAYAFYGCSSMKYVTIPLSVKDIGHDVFYNSDLRRAYYCGTEADWEEVDMSSENSKLNSVRFYYYSETQPPVKGNYWYYDNNGKVAFWKFN